MGDLAKEEIKAIFKKYDTNGDGFISIKELSNVLRAVSEWDDDELRDMFAAMDGGEDGKVSFEEFVDWVMAAEDEDGDMLEEIFWAAEDMGNGMWEDDMMMEKEEEAEEEEDSAEQNLELSSVTLPQLKKLVLEFGMAAGDAKPLYDAVVEYMTQDGDEPPSEEEGVPLILLLEHLGIELDDCEVMKWVCQVWNGIQQEGSSEQEEETESTEEAAMQAALDRLAQKLEQEGASHSDAHQVIQDGQIQLSPKEEEMLQQVPQEELEIKVQHAMETSALHECAGYQAMMARCADAVNKIIEECKADGKKFTDPDWDPLTSPEQVLYVDKEGPGYDCTVTAPADWKRITEIVESPVLCKDSAMPNDIVQGAIGSCFLLGAMGSIVGRDNKAMKKIFIKYDFEVGVFAVRFCIDGEWGFVIIDDIMPVNEHGQLLYASSKDPNEVWCPLLEKAYCKLHTCYEMCDGGQCSEASFCFLGGVTGHFPIQEKHREDPSSYFKLIKNACKRGFLLTSGFSPQEGASGGGGQGKCGEDMLPCGLVGGHAYSVLRAVEAEGNYLFQIRNPWGSGEWTGKWSDSNPEGEWTDSMKEACAYSSEEDGKFWMSVEDYIANSGGMEYSRTFGPNWKKVSKSARFMKGEAASMKATVCEAFESEDDDVLSLTVGEELTVDSLFGGGWCSGKKASGEEGWFPLSNIKMKKRPVARYDLSGEEPGKKAVIMLMQPNVMFQRKFYKRKEDGKNYKNTEYHSIMLVVVGSDGKVLFRSSSPERCLWTQVTLPPDGVKIYALSKDGTGDKFTVRVYAQTAVTLKEATDTTVKELTEVLNSQG